MDEYGPFADVYDEWAQDMTEDVPFYVALAREAEGPIVELAVGNGRVAIPVARETGRKVIGIDRSPAMLAQARERVADTGVDVELREQDMRDFELEEQAGLVYCPFRALLHLPTWADRRRVFERVAAALKPGGRFAWNVFVFDIAIAASYADRLRRRPDGKTWEWTEYDPTDSRIDLTVRRLPADAVQQRQPRVRLDREEAGMSRQAARNPLLPTRVGSLVPPATQRQRNPRRCTPL